MKFKSTDGKVAAIIDKTDLKKVDKFIEVVNDSAVASPFTEQALKLAADARAYFATIQAGAPIKGK